MPDWEDIRYFLALARAGTLSAAARALKVNHATVARRVAAFEASIGQPLFERRPEGYALTGPGQVALAGAEDMERSAVTIGDGAAHAELAGTVRITTVASIANALLIDGLAEFAQRNAALVLEIETDTEVLSLARRQADVALRLGRPKDSGLHGRKLTDVHYAFYAAPRLARHINEGVRPGLIGYGVAAEAIAEAAWVDRAHASTRIAMRANSVEAHRVAAIAGVGVALLPRYVGDTDRRLREVAALGPAMPPRELWLLCPRELARTVRVRAVLDAIADTVARHRATIEGRVT